MGGGRYACCGLLRRSDALLPFLVSDLFCLVGLLSWLEQQGGIVFVWVVCFFLFFVIPGVVLVELLEVLTDVHLHVVLVHGAQVAELVVLEPLLVLDVMKVRSLDS